MIRALVRTVAVVVVVGLVGCGVGDAGTGAGWCSECECASPLRDEPCPSGTERRERMDGPRLVTECGRVEGGALVLHGPRQVWLEGAKVQQESWRDGGEDGCTTWWREDGGLVGQAVAVDGLRQGWWADRQGWHCYVDGEQVETTFGAPDLPCPPAMD